MGGRLWGAGGLWGEGIVGAVGRLEGICGLWGVCIIGVVCRIRGGGTPIVVSRIKYNRASRQWQ